MNKLYLLLTVDRSPELMRQSLHYYSSYDFDRIFISIEQGAYTDKMFFNDIASLASEFGAMMLAMHGESSLPIESLRQRVVTNQCQDGDWLFMSNVDEFHQYSSRPHELVSGCQENEINMITGHFLDRLGPYGDFPDIDERPVWNCFPVAARLTKNILIGAAEKVVAVRIGSYRPSNSSKVSMHKQSTTYSNIIVHQFKWDSSAFERSRYQVWKRSVLGDPGFIIPLRFLRYTSGKSMIDLKDQSLDTFWPCYCRTNQSDVDQMGVNREIPAQAPNISDPVFARPLQNPDISLRTDSGMNVLFDATNRSGTRISDRGVQVWSQCDGKQSVAEISGNILPPFDFNSEIEIGLQVFIRELVNLGIIRYVN